MNKLETTGLIIGLLSLTIICISIGFVAGLINNKINNETIEPEVIYKISTETVEVIRYEPRYINNTITKVEYIEKDCKQEVNNALAEFYKNKGIKLLSNVYRDFSNEDYELCRNNTEEGLGYLNIYINLIEPDTNLSEGYKDYIKAIQTVYNFCLVSNDSTEPSKGVHLRYLVLYSAYKKHIEYWNIYNKEEIIIDLI